MLWVKEKQLFSTSSGTISLADANSESVTVYKLSGMEATNDISYKVHYSEIQTANMPNHCVWWIFQNSIDFVLDLFL